MKNLMENDYAQHLSFAVICCMVLSLLFDPASSCAESPASVAAPQDTLRLGERMYREGILPSGKPLQASIKEGAAVPGITFACVSCHLRSGVGALDEGTYIPSVNGKKLFKPLPRQYKGIEQSSKSSLLPLRPAYTEASLIKVLRSGVDPNDRVLNEVMPRYLLEDRDAQLLVAYLKSLSSQFSPGVSDTTIRFATVISEDIRPEISEAMFNAFDQYFNIKNNQIKAFSNPRGRNCREPW